jgi:hypothetical protein
VLLVKKEDVDMLLMSQPDQDHNALLLSVTKAYLEELDLAISEGEVSYRASTEDIMAAVKKIR